MGRPAVGILLLLTLAAGGCRGVGPIAATRPASIATTPGLRIGVVDLDRVARAHPRWPELEALNKRLAEVEGQLAAPPQIPPAVQARLEAQLRAQGKKLEGEFRREMQALQERQRARLARYVAELRTEQKQKLARFQAQLDAELRTALETRARALRTELRQYELQVNDEYRFPIANLRLKADVIGVETEEELRRITGELVLLLNERDAKVRARAEVVDVVLQDFQKAKQAEATGRLSRAQQEAEAEINRLAEAKRRELDAEVQRRGKAKQRDFQARVNVFRRRLLGIGQGQLVSAQRRYVEGLRQRERQLLAERAALGEQRTRLQDAILADVKIEVAAIAAAKGFDVVLTRFLSNPGGEDFTADVLARMPR